MLGGLWMVKIGINRGLWLFGVVQLVSILGFALAGDVGTPDLRALAGVIAFEALGVGLGTVALRRVHRARHRSALHRDAVRAVHEPVRGAAHARQRHHRLDGRRSLGWFDFFLLCTLLAVPGMALLLRVAPWNDRATGRGLAMNPHKFSAIAHRDHDYCNPMSSGKIERLLDLLPLDDSSRVLDLGCGRAELALRIIERFGSQRGRHRQARR